MEKLRFNFKIWLETSEGVSIFGDGKYALLKCIERTGSLKAAMEEMGLSYRKTWDKLKKIEDTLGFPILETTQGGCEGGCTVLTPYGKEFIKAFEDMHKKCDAFFQEAFNEVLKDISVKD